MNTTRHSIPKYIRQFLARAEFVLGKGDPGYTIDVRKRSHYCYADTLAQECNDFLAWCRRQLPKDYDWQEAPLCIIDYVPSQTHYKYMQYARLTVYDPIMLHIEKYITR